VGARLGAHANVLTPGAVVITGASTGIGRATARYLAARGVRVFAGVRRAQDAEALRGEGAGGVTPIQLDVTDRQSIARAAREVEAALDGEGLLGLVNNAGIGIGAPLEFIDLDELRRQLEVNVIGPVAVTQAFLSQVRTRRGRIVNVGSIGGRIAQPIMGPYNASKYALEALSDSLRMELGAWGIHVALVEPGAIATAIWEKTDTYAEQMIPALGARAGELYGDAIGAVLDTARMLSKRAIPPEAVSRAIFHALTARRPRTRYLVGTDARAEALLARFLPDRARDAVLMRIMKYPRRAPR
jgi:NAD(P)-dependent dehydrogenase (short-subunit alcohol dehydrogenase family)